MGHIRHVIIELAVAADNCSPSVIIIKVDSVYYLIVNVKVNGSQRHVKHKHISRSSRNSYTQSTLVFMEVDL